MIATFDNSDNKWELTELPPTVKVEQFREQDIWIYYGVRPDVARRGVLSIKVIRTFEGIGNSKFFEETGIFRSDGFVDKRGKEIGPLTLTFVPRQEYSDFHAKGKTHPMLANKFHAYWDKPSVDEVYTASGWRRIMFLFPASKEDNSSLQTSYLLRYDTTENGSWIPFAIGTTSDFQRLIRILIIVTDLGANNPDAEIKRVLMRSP